MNEGVNECRVVMILLILKEVEFEFGNKRLRE